MAAPLTIIVATLLAAREVVVVQATGALADKEAPPPPPPAHTGAAAVDAEAEAEPEPEPEPTTRAPQTEPPPYWDPPYYEPPRRPPRTTYVATTSVATTSARTTSVATTYARTTSPGTTWNPYQCNFGSPGYKVPPSFPTHYWDWNCRYGMPGCNADYRSVQCRWCGGGYPQIACPWSSCHFAEEPWDRYYWDSSCEEGKLGCKANGFAVKCRFCGSGPYASIPCPPGDQASPRRVGQCTFPNEPMVPYFWDENCLLGHLGCLGDGIHVQCRLCIRVGDDRRNEVVHCPPWVYPREGRCDLSWYTSPLPSGLTFVWDTSCKWDDQNCYADRRNLFCRYCWGNDVRCRASAATASGSVKALPAGSNGSFVEGTSMGTSPSQNASSREEGNGLRLLL